MDINFGRDDLNAEGAERKEWLVTNGLGGFAASTITGLNTRRYHGLLVAALQPPVRRFLLVSKLDEDLWIDGCRYVLGTNQVRGGYAQEGYRYLERFERFPFPTFIYRIDDVFLSKTIFMVYGTNSTVVHYRLINQTERDISLCLFPMVNARDYHGNISENDWPFRQELSKDGRRVAIEAYPGAPLLYMSSDRAHYIKKRAWYRGMYYAAEAERGLSDFEDHYLPGYFRIHTDHSEEFYLSFSTLEHLPLDYPELLKRALRRRDAVMHLAGDHDEFAATLVLAADDFLVRRQSNGMRTIMAGYPWFCDWGRDAMISLPGLTLCTGRFQTAREILSAFAGYQKGGLLPNVFSDCGGEPLYNTVDAPLWFFFAVQKYLEYTKDYSFIKERIYPIMCRIIEGYRRGTDFQIRMDEDGLISAGSPGVQLTWMDAKVGDWVVTPRCGKPVEINALWYNALRMLSDLAERYGAQADYAALADRVYESFQRLFWNRQLGCLYDVVDGERCDPSIRPNQILAVSLPYGLLEGQQARAVVDRVWRELYTGVGLRSLSPKDQAYLGHYGGPQRERDAAYHQGTVWSWLIGHFISAYQKVYGAVPESRQMIDLFFQPLKDHLYQHGIGTVSEIFDGDPPHKPGGCFAQAWGVAEVLRSYLESGSSRSDN
jgi:predicted glycogen debranching enzyme